MTDIYPMPSFVTLEVRDVAASLAWYRDVLGFDVVMAFAMPGGAPTFAHLRWTRYADLLLRPGTEAPGHGVTISYQVALERLDALAERARAAGAKLLSEPTNRPWNARDFIVADPSGYRLCFTAGPVNKDLTMRDITAQLSSAGTSP